MTARTFSFISGLTLGAAVMLLYAPKKGVDTRAALAKGATDTQRFVQRRTSDVRKTVRNVMRKGRKAYRTTAHGMAYALEQGRRVLA
jgi:gas vesicle protein